MSARARKCKRSLALLVPLLLAVVGAAGVAGATEPLVVPPQTRLLVVAPHPDDESLGAGGLIQRTLAADGRVHVVFVTSGDGYRDAVTRATGRLQPTAVDYRSLGELRRAEALVALENYRLLPLSVAFLGFPDGGLAEIWRRGPHVPAYESPYTREDRPPYPEAFDPNARYVSRDLVRQLAHLVALARPDWIVLPTPLDNHPDHCASFAFTLAALHSLAAGRDGAALVPARLLTYLVHAGGWPPPPAAPGALPVPPQTFAPAHWSSLALTPAEVALKRAALESHRTQDAVMRGLFRALTRPNELFGVLERDAFMRLTPGEPACPTALPGDGAPAAVPALAPPPAAPPSAAAVAAAPPPVAPPSTTAIAAAPHARAVQPRQGRTERGS